MVEWYGKAVSVNSKFEPKIEPKTGSPRFVITYKYIRFLNTIKKACFGKLKKFDGYVDLHLWVWLKPNFNTDNILKPVCDGIKESRVILDDKYIKDIHVYRNYSRYGEDDIIKFELHEISKN